MNRLLALSLLCLCATSELHAQPPLGDNCSNPIMLSESDFVFGNTCGYSNDYDWACPYGGSTARDVVYLYLPVYSQMVILSLCASSYDTKLYVYDGSCTGSPMACNDDYGHHCGPGGYASLLQCLRLLAGHSYYVVVDGYGSECGDYVLQVLPMTPPPPPNSLVLELVPPDVVLHWPPVFCSLGYYVYRSLSSSVEPEPSNLIAVTSDTFLVEDDILESSSRYFYTITAEMP